MKYQVFPVEPMQFVGILQHKVALGRDVVDLLMSC